MDDYLNAIVNHFGKQLQIQKFSEECIELHKAINNYEYGINNSIDDIAEEIADVSVMLDQLCIIYNIHSDIINHTKIRKIKRTLDRYNI